MRIHAKNVMGDVRALETSGGDSARAKRGNLVGLWLRFKPVTPDLSSTFPMVTDYPQVHPATQLIPIGYAAPEDDRGAPPLPPGISADDLPFVEYEPSFESLVTELQRVCWLAGEASLDFQRSIEVVVNPDGRPPGYALKFYGPPDFEQMSVMYVGADSGAVKTFLDGMRYHRTAIRRGLLD